MINGHLAALLEQHVTDPADRAQIRSAFTAVLVEAIARALSGDLVPPKPWSPTKMHRRALTYIAFGVSAECRPLPATLRRPVKSLRARGLVHAERLELTDKGRALYEALQARKP